MTKTPQHDAHVVAYTDHILDWILSQLCPIGAPAGWSEWSRYAAQGEW
jgi:hypothetical protein